LEISMNRSTLTLAVLAAAALFGQPAFAAEKSCAAVTFRGLPPGAAEGQMSEAGLYNARFGRITIDGKNTGGEAGDFAIAVKGKTLEPAAQLPKGVEPCLKAKGMPVPASASVQACHGEQLKLAIVPEGQKRVLVLYAGRPGTWNYCRTSVYGG
jgi:hypothetical protein